MSRVRFIEPMSQPYSPYSRYVRQFPLMGPMILATLLERRGHDVSIYNENLTGSVLDDPLALEDLREADVVGISIMTPTAARGYRIATALRRARAHPRVVFGGVHATFRPHEALQYADIVVTGEGEGVIADIVEGRVETGIVRGTPVLDLDALPLPNHELVRGLPQRWASTYVKRLYEFPIVTSRGCPQACRYCSVSAQFGRRYRAQSARKVIGDIQSLYERGFRRFFFYDDNFTADRARVREVLEGIRGMDLSWSAQTRLDFHWLDPKRRRGSDRPLLDAMQRAGADALYIGYETLDEEQARRWRQGYAGAGTLEHRCAEDTRILRERGFWIHGMFILSPDHDEAAADRIVQFAQRQRLDSLQISALTPFPGTALFEEVRDRILFDRYPEDWVLYDGMHAVYRGARMEIARFQESLLRAYRAFYRCSALSLSRLRKWLRGPGNLWEKARYVLATVRTPAALLRNWEEEMRRFIASVQALGAAAVPAARERRPRLARP